MPVGTMDYSQTVFEQSFIGNCLKKSKKEERTTSKEVKEEEFESEAEGKLPKFSGFFFSIFFRRGSLRRSLLLTQEGLNRRFSCPSG